MLGSCTCCTKTPDVKYHATDCDYRLVNEVLEYVQGIHRVVNEERDRLNRISANINSSRDVHCSPDEYCEYCSDGRCVNCETSVFTHCDHDWYDRHFEIKQK